MTPERAPFPCGWPGSPLEGLGLDALRGGQGTYGLYEFAQLPQLPEALHGDFRWLTDQDDAPEWAIGGDDAEKTWAALDRLRALDLALPEVFVAFLASPALQRKIRSVTACFIDLCPVPNPIGEGRVVRFLSDQQGCLFWYLYLAPDGEHAVLASPGFYGAPEEDWGALPPTPEQVWFCAPSFEAFLFRFWLENEIAFIHCHGSDDSSPSAPPAVDAYLEAYRRRARELAVSGQEP